jgi:hypothetical protein
VITAVRKAGQVFTEERTNGHRPAAPPRTPVLTSLGRLAGRHLPRWKTVRTTVLAVGGFAWIDVAAWGVDWRLGAAAIGVSGLVLEYLSGDSE